MPFRGWLTERQDQVDLIGIVSMTTKQMAEPINHRDYSLKKTEKAFTPILRTSH
jgi:hypothetical protein